MLTHLAVVIDLKEERLEKTEIPFLRKQLSEDLEKLLKRFETEYQEFLVSTGQSCPAEMLRRAA